MLRARIRSFCRCDWTIWFDVQLTPTRAHTHSLTFSTWILNDWGKRIGKGQQPARPRQNKPRQGACMTSRMRSTIPVLWAVLPAAAAAEVAVGDSVCDYLHLIKTLKCSLCLIVFVREKEQNGALDTLFSGVVGAGFTSCKPKVERPLFRECAIEFNEGKALKD